jgi:lipopolysaccharide transport system ATP-binding protein
MTDPVIKVENLSKGYRLGAREERPDTLVGAMIRTAAAPINNFRKLRRLDTFATEDDNHGMLWALKDVSFEIAPGDVVGFVGRNGAGKSTLLKILSRITEPTHGRVELHGRVSSLLEVGTGFHPELTGRENVYMNGTILGMKKAEIDERFDEIVDFSGVERFLDTPVKRYSSGMKVRLAFAVAAHMEPEILIIDEVLAVGDAEFQKKCLGKMQSVATGGRTVLFVSHNLGAVQSLCSRGIFLAGGELMYDGSVKQVIEQYMAIAKVPDELRFSDANPARGGAGTARFTSVEMLASTGTVIEQCMGGEAIAIRFRYQVHEDVRSAYLKFTIFTALGQPVCNIGTDLLGHAIHSELGSHEVLCHIPALPLVEGQYIISSSLRNDDGILDLIPEALTFQVIGCMAYEAGKMPAAGYGSLLLQHTWA